MINVKKINLFLCLVFSFTFLFSNIFLVQAESIQEQQTLQKCIDPKEYPKEIAECKVCYRVKNTDNGGNGKIVWTVGERKFRMVEKPWYMSNYDYKFGPSSVKISADRKSAKIFVTLTRDGFGFWNWGEKINLTFELQIN